MEALVFVGVGIMHTYWWHGRVEGCLALAHPRHW